MAALAKQVGGHCTTTRYADIHENRIMLPDVLSKGLTLVVCGTAASSESAAREHYYAGPGNKFWRTLHETRLTRRQLAPAEYREVLRDRIGLTDLIKGQSGGDAAISFAAEARSVLHDKILQYAPAYLCFNGKRAAKQYFGKSHVEYGLQRERLGHTLFFVAPSTSGAANAYWDLAMWRALGVRVVRARRAA